MRNLALTALLLLPVAAAQTVPAIPATPGTSTTTSTASPATPAVAPTAPANAPTLLLTAPVGSGVELVMTQVMSAKVSDVQVTAAPGAKVTEAQLNDIRRSLSSSFAKGLPTTTTTGKMFVKVTGRDASGQTTLLTSAVQTLPELGPVTIKSTQLVGPDGKTTFKSIQSDNPQVAAIFKSLTPEKMQAYATQNGTDVASVYSKPLVVGETQTTKSTVDAQEIFRTVLSAAGLAEGKNPFGSISASPLEVTTALTYKGQNAQRQLTFETVSNIGNWQVNLTPSAGAGAADSMKMNVALQNATTKGTSVYRPDGLPVSMSVNVNMNMQMTMLMQDVQVKMTMSMEQTITFRPR